ncbi:hypothetical protein [Candidatus Nitrosocosmicus franklandus]|nr:hypothetical protein [Candidatus Nitrosocosmicus franklandus]
MQNEKFTNGLMMSTHSLYKAIAANEIEDQVIDAFCSKKNA